MLNLMWISNILTILDINLDINSRFNNRIKTFNPMNF